MCTGQTTLWVDKVSGQIRVLPQTTQVIFARLLWHEETRIFSVQFCRHPIDWPGRSTHGAFFAVRHYGVLNIIFDVG